MHLAARGDGTIISITWDGPGLAVVVGSVQPTGSSDTFALVLVRHEHHFTLVVVDFAPGPLGLPGSYNFNSWSFQLPLGEASIGPHLESAHVNTAATLGPFGKVNLTLGSVTKLRKTPTTSCDFPYEAVARETTRTGSVSGSVHFTPHEGSVPDLQFAKATAYAQHRIDSATRCPGPPACTPRGVGSAADATDGISLSGYLGSNELTVRQHERVGTAYESHFITAYSKTALVVTNPLSGLSINTTGLSPLVSGSLKFAPTSGGITPKPHCDIERLAQAWSSGTLTANFETGAVPITGPSLVGTSVSRKKTR